jgi:hypothetical protein
MSESVLNRMVELVKSGTCFANGVKEPHMMKVANDVPDFTALL